MFYWEKSDRLDQWNVLNLLTYNFGTKDNFEQGGTVPLMGHRDKSYYRWRCMLTATPRTDISTKDASFDGVWGQISLVFLFCFMFCLHLERNGTSKMGLQNGTSNLV